MIRITTAYRFLTVIGLGLAISLLDLLELANPTISEALLLCVSIGKSAYFIWFTFYNIRETAGHDFY
ncbi:MAG: hypothetical protein KDC65_18285, partial [Saprospiraceae bacterium]|nr:hypothetical protein [Saprospiraceae bacterium]